MLIIKNMFLMIITILKNKMVVNSLIYCKIIFYGLLMFITRYKIL